MVEYLALLWEKVSSVESFSYYFIRSQHYLLFFLCRIGVGCMYGFTIVDYLKNTTVHISSTFTEVNLEQGHLSRMQSIRKSFRQSLKRLNVRRSLRGGQSTQRSFRPALVRSGSTRPSMKNRAAVGGGSPPTSVEATPMPPRRDSIRSITFSAPCHIGRELLSSLPFP